MQTIGILAPTITVYIRQGTRCHGYSFVRFLVLSNLGISAVYTYDILRGRRGVLSLRSAARAPAMVHNMDAMSAKWRDDPVRAALEKKKNREAAADRMAAANVMASEILKKKLEKATSSSLALADEEAGTSMSDADYRQV